MISDISFGLGRKFQPIFYTQNIIVLGIVFDSTHTFGYQSYDFG